MAGSRLHKFGSIFSRMDGLMRSKALKPEDKPLWFDVYKAFPPEVEPTYERPLPDQTVRKIIYPEDYIRVKFRKTFGQTDVVNLATQSITKPRSERFIELIRKLKQEGVENDKLFDTALKRMKEDEKLQSLHPSMPNKL